MSNLIGIDVDKKNEDVKAMLDNIYNARKLVKEVAEYQKERYDSFIEVGFTPEQAMQLIK